MTITLRTLALLAVSSGALANVSPKIVGGDNAGSDYPWMVGLHQYDPGAGDYYVNPFCGGSLVAPGWVVTAAHCLVGDSAENVLLRIDQPDIGSAPNYIVPAYEAQALILHKAYQNSFGGFDIALVKLADKVGVPTISIADESVLFALNSQPTDNNAVRALGWGVYDNEVYNPSAPGSPVGENANPYPETLQAVDLDFVPFSRIFGTRPANVVGAREIVPNPVTQPYGADTCFGDSGGPLLVPQGSTRITESAEHPVLVGATSFGSERCDSRLSTGIYTNVAAYTDWIEQQTAVHGDALADLAISLSHSTRDLPPGSTSDSFALTVTNRSHSTAIDSFTFQPLFADSTSPSIDAGSGLSCSAPGGVLECTGNRRLEAGESASYDFTVTDTLNLPRTTSISARITTQSHDDYRHFNNSDTLEVNYTNDPDLLVALTGVSTLRGSVNVSVANLSDYFAATAALLVVEITPAARVSLPDNCEQASETRIECELGDLPPSDADNGALSLTLPALDSREDGYDISASISHAGNDQDTSNNTASYSDFRPLPQSASSGMLAPSSGSGGAAALLLCLLASTGLRRLARRY